MEIQVSNSFHKLNAVHPYASISADNKVIIGDEGGSRSGKTRSIAKYLTLFSQSHPNQNYPIRVFREDNKNCMATVYEDFVEVWNEFNQWERKNLHATRQTYTHFGNRFIFHGLDDRRSHGLKSAVSYFNEALDMDSPQAFKQINMRTDLLTIMDWNPRCTDHWVFDLEKRPDARFIRSTWKDNAFIPKANLLEILAYEPTPENIKNGTADEYMWKVYGCGERASLTGLVFPDVTWIDMFPEVCNRITYGMDFGHTNSPTTISKVGLHGRDLYLQKLFYEPCDNPDTLTTILNKQIGTSHIWSDSAEKDLIASLRNKGVKCLAAHKTIGSVTGGIDIMKQYKIHLVRDIDVKKEADNYKWREVGGISLNEPVKGFDHFWDACRYACMMEFR